jgi:hypothetical protein
MMILSGLFAFLGALLRGNSGRAVSGLCRSVIKFLRKAVDGLQGRRGLGGEPYQCRAPEKNFSRFQIRATKAIAIITSQQLI